MRPLLVGVVGVLGLVGLACGGATTPAGDPAFAVIAWEGDSAAAAADVVTRLTADRTFVREGYPRVVTADDGVQGLPFGRAAVLLGQPRSAEVAQELTSHAVALGLKARHQAVTTTDAEDLRLWVVEASRLEWQPGVNGLDQRPAVVLTPQGFTVSMLAAARPPGKCNLSRPQSTSEVPAVDGKVVIPWVSAEGSSPCLSAWAPTDRTVAACDTLLLEGLPAGAHPDPADMIGRISMAKAFCFEEHGP